ncbi:MAG: NAD(P)-dependent oxidoreductase [SAR202 cluster bacterium]|jgi:3-hydroxyisobutyrate dehydrogenase|nr:NAD(P)-dependent oxidoreductase [SAR202 cluster bacterium]
MQVGFIGTGNIGQPMASHLLNAGLKLLVYDVRKEAAQSLVDGGAIWVNSPKEAARLSEIVFTCLPGPSEMEDVMFGENGVAGNFSHGSLYIDFTTNSPALIRRVHGMLAEKGVAMLDAPVSGGLEGAKTRDLTMLVGGDAAEFQRARPILEAIAKTVIHVGGIGTGSICKVAHNSASFARSLALIECLTLGVKAGVDAEVMLEVFQKCALGNNFDLHVRMPSTIFRGDFNPRFALKTAFKDIRLAIELAEQHDVPTEVVSVCEKDMARAMEKGLSDLDSSVFLTLQEERAGVKVRIGLQEGE